MIIKKWLVDDDGVETGRFNYFCPTCGIRWRPSPPRTTNVEMRIKALNHEIKYHERVT